VRLPPSSVTRSAQTGVSYILSARSLLSNHLQRQFAAAKLQARSSIASSSRRSTPFPRKSEQKPRNHDVMSGLAAKVETRGSTPPLRPDRTLIGKREKTSGRRMFRNLDQSCPNIGLKRFTGPIASLETHPPSRAPLLCSDKFRSASTTRIGIVKLLVTYSRPKQSRQRSVAPQVSRLCLRLVFAS